MSSPYTPLVVGAGTMAQLSKQPFVATASHPSLATACNALRDYVLETATAEEMRCQDVVRARFGVHEISGLHSWRRNLRLQGNENLKRTTG